MTWLASMRIALRALRVNKLRSTLTMFGIIIGVAAVILMIAIGGDLDMNRGADDERTVEVGERHRQRRGGDVHVRLVGPGARQALLAKGKVFEVGDDRPRVRRELANLCAHGRRRVERNDRLTEVATVPTGSAADIGAHAGRCTRNERVETGRSCAPGTA